MTQHNAVNATSRPLPTVADVEAAVVELYNPAFAEEWDRVGLICGDRRDEVKRILVATDPVADVVDEAIALEADFILTHHPLFLRGVSFLTAQSAKGNVVHRLIQHGCALMNAHTNADAAENGVAVALAELVGLRDYEPLEPSRLDPALGIGRVGCVTPQTLGEFAQFVASQLPASPHGIFVGGDLDATISRVAVSGGAGDSLLERARTVGADVFITADLRHHPTSEHLEEGMPYLICGSHWATEAVWIPWAVQSLSQIFPQTEVIASRVISEPWNAHFPTTGAYPRKLTNN